jgi:hypothetical protein
MIWLSGFISGYFVGGMMVSAFIMWWMGRAP